jgi:hypothetical protein
MIGFPKDQIKVGLINANSKTGAQAFACLQPTKDPTNQLLSLSNLNFSDTQFAY